MIFDQIRDPGRSLSKMGRRAASPLPPRQDFVLLTQAKSESPAVITRTGS
jgi:hypothetical protein